MRRGFAALLALVVGAGVVVGGIGAGASTAAGAAPRSEVVSGRSGLTPDAARTGQTTAALGQQQALAQYWSPERMRTALPASQVPSVKRAIANTKARKQPAKPPSKPDGPTVKIAPWAPESAPEPDVAPAAAAIAPQSYKPGYPVGHPVARTYGKVFFTNAGLNYVCSGTVVNTEGKSTVWTAGHCVSDGGSWNDNWVFVPNYSNGSAPYGLWSSHELHTTAAWFKNNNDLANDLGAATMNRTNGSRINERLGGQGIEWNASTSHHVYTFGYPQAPPFNGAYLFACNGSTFDNGSSTIGIACDMTGGSSGGAWLSEFNGSWGHINGHNDFKDETDPNHLYSPYYGDNAGGLYDAVRCIST